MQPTHRDARHYTKNSKVVFSLHHPSQSFPLEKTVQLCCVLFPSRAHMEIGYWLLLSNTSQYTRARSGFLLSYHAQSLVASMQIPGDALLLLRREKLSQTRLQKLCHFRIKVVKKLKRKNCVNGLPQHSIISAHFSKEPRSACQYPLGELEAYSSH